MRKEIVDFLEDAKKPPSELPHIDFDRHLSSILEIYRRADIATPNVLAEDCFALLSRYRLFKISYESGTDFLQYGMDAIEKMVYLLIIAAGQYTQLPDSAIMELSKFPLGDATFGEHLKQLKTAYSGTNRVIPPHPQKRRQLLRKCPQD